MDVVPLWWVLGPQELQINSIPRSQAPVWMQKPAERVPGCKKNQCDGNISLQYYELCYIMSTGYTFFPVFQWGMWEFDILILLFFLIGERHQFLVLTSCNLQFKHHDCNIIVQCRCYSTCYSTTLLYTDSVIPVWRSIPESCIFLKWHMITLKSFIKSVIREKSDILTLQNVKSMPSITD